MAKVQASVLLPYYIKDRPIFSARFKMAAFLFRFMPPFSIGIEQPVKLFL